MPTKEISTKCNVFLQLVTLRPHQHSTHLKIRRSADPLIRILPEAVPDIYNACGEKRFHKSRGVSEIICPVPDVR